ncbi:hypothetical protein ACCO45_002713 [Purpureocillium lilacinum]|uniref:Uncharacterized protein n=1 Tax=Purpureocillium lilacinum TaxID=33203 RepID=A0ACC4E0Q3_PURLI
MTDTTPTSSAPDMRIALIGAGTIGLSLAALHLTHLPDASQLTIMDVRPDLESYVATVLPTYLPPGLRKLAAEVKLTERSREAGLQDAVVGGSREGRPAGCAALDEHLWDPRVAAERRHDGQDEAARGAPVQPATHPPSAGDCAFAPDLAGGCGEDDGLWRRIGREPILLSREITGFVAGRLAWALLREAIHLVDEDVVTVEQLDRIIQTSMGPRWAYAGPFKSFQAGGGPGGLRALLGNVGGTVQACWDDGGRVNMGGPWESKVFAQADEAYGQPDLEERDRANRMVLRAVREARSS